MSARAKPLGIADRVQANPFQFFSCEEVAELFGFGRDTMTALIAAGAPVVGRKMNPQLLLEWLRVHHSDIGKIRES